MKKFAIYLLCSLSLVVFMTIQVGCKRNEIEPTVTDFGYDYFPLSVGTTWEYQVDSIQYKPYVPGIDTFQFMVKHVVADTLTDAAGIKSNIINVYYTDSMGGSYKLNRSITKRIHEFRAETIDTNIKSISLVFPPVKLKYWDANAFNSNALAEFEIIDYKNAEVIGDASYKDVVHVLHVDEDFKTIKNYGIEKYSKHFGLVYAKHISWTKERLNDSTEIPDGYDYTYTLKSFKR